MRFVGTWSRWSFNLFCAAIVRWLLPSISFFFCLQISFYMPQSTPSILRFFDSDVGREFLCRLLRASHCGTCMTNQLRCRTMEEIIMDSSFQSFVEEACELWAVESVVGPFVPYSRVLESPEFALSLDPSIDLDRKCSILCQLRFAVSRVVDIFYVLENAGGRRYRRRRSGDEIDWRSDVIPLFQEESLLFGEVYRLPVFCSLISSVSEEPHGDFGAVTGYTGASFLHFLVSFHCSCEDDHVAALRVFNAVDRATVSSDQLLLSEDRDPIVGSAAYYFRRSFDTTGSQCSDDFAAVSPVFSFLRHCYRSGPLHVANDADDIGQPRSGHL